MRIFTEKAIVLALSLFFFIPVDSLAQLSAGGFPVSWDANHLSLFENKSIQVVNIPDFDRQKAIKEDELNGGSRFAAPIDVNYALENEGTWTYLSNGDRVWQLELFADGAEGIFVYYEDFYMPRGARCYMYAPDKTNLKGAYTSRNNKSSGKFMTGMVKGERAILEYYEPKAVRGQGIIDISKIYYAYKNDTEFTIPDNVIRVKAGFGDALPCHTNINCSEAGDWQDHKRGVVRILRVFDEGVGWCSGSMINNTNEDETPYVLSAFHCYDGFTPQLDVWRFDFNYESENCSNPGAEPDYNSMMGCHYRAGWSDTDVLLLELLENIPGSYNIRFNGWNRTLSHLPDTSTIIHHPQGDVKKFSQDYDDASIHPNSIMWSNGVTTPPNHHYEVTFDLGTFENGSSGSSMLDEDGRIVGQLHGGNSSCSTFLGYFGRFSLSWDEGPTMSQRLMEWLDPANTGQLILDALEPAGNGMIEISGYVEARTGQPMPNLEVIADDGTTVYNTFTDGNGNYLLEIPAGVNYTIYPFKNDDPDNGVSTFDIVKTARDILQIEPFTDPFQSVAADVNNNGGVSSIDLVRMRQLILGINPDFPESTSWRFSPEQENTDTDSVFDFTGIKIGDPSGNASPD